MSSTEASRTAPSPTITAPTRRPATPPSPAVPAQSPPADPELRWRHAGRALLAKTIAEFAYEELLAPRQQDDGWHSLTLDAAGGGHPPPYPLPPPPAADRTWVLGPARG